jgi:hypothetical protein
VSIVPGNWRFEMKKSSNEFVLWVELSSMSKTAKKETLKFIQNFPELEFYQDDALIFEKLEKSNKIKLPQWFCQARQTLAFVKSKQPIWAQFDKFVEWSPRLDLLGELWYTLNLRGYANKEEQKFLTSLETLSLFPIGETNRAGEGVLAINIGDSSDQAIYEFNLEDLWDNSSAELSPEDSVYPVFNSYSQMLSHIISVKISCQGGDEMIFTAL